MNSHLVSCIPNFKRSTVTEEPAGDQWCRSIATERRLQKDNCRKQKIKILKSWVPASHKPQNRRSTVRKTSNEYQRWGIIDEEIMVQKYDFEEEIYVLDRRTGESQN